MTVPFVRSPYNYDVMKASNESGVDCSVDKGRTQQSFEDETNINSIVRRYGLTGALPTNVAQVMQGDFTQVVDFQSAMDLIVKARESFDAMPADVRGRFDNDPGKFVDFTSKPENFDEAAKFGLVRPEAVEARKRVAEAAKASEIAAAVAAAQAAPKAP